MSPSFFLDVFRCFIFIVCKALPLQKSVMVYKYHIYHREKKMQDTTKELNGKCHFFV